MSADAASLRGDVRVIGLVGVGHGVSHFYQLVLPPLFPLIKDDLDISYAALGFATALFYIVSGVCQMLAGFVVDRYGARPVLLGGFVLSVAGVLLAGFSRSYEMLLLSAVVGGLGNSVFHPADYAILNARVNVARLGYAFSWHGIAGFFGYAAAPGFSALMATALGWNGALLVAGALGIVFLCVVFAMRESLYVDPASHQQAPEHRLADDLKILASMPVLMCFFYFVLVSVAFIAMQAFGVSTLVAIFDMPIAAASAALSIYLLASAFGILAGGILTTKYPRHNIVAAAGVGVSAMAILLVAVAPIPAAAVPLLLAISGFAAGVTNPSRDMIVRHTTPPGATGKVYGFVYSGIDVGSMLMPVIFGWMLDQNNPRGVLLAMVIALLITIVTVLNLPTRPVQPR